MLRLAAPGASGAAPSPPRPHNDQLRVSATSPASPSPTLVIGVLGGIASGKSRVARGLAGPDPERGLVLEADAIAHELLGSEDGAAFVRETFGEEFLGPDGRPDRAALGRLVFDAERGPEARATLEDWIHPRVRARIFALLDGARASGTRVCVLDVPLLLENDTTHGFARACDTLVFVDVPHDVRDRRAVETRGWPPGEVARRERAQLPLAEKRSRANHVLTNHGSPEELDRAVALLRTELGLD